jgi:hypothetical protein
VTTHETRPETVEPTEGTGRVESAEPTAEPRPAEPMAEPRPAGPAVTTEATDVPAETGSPSGNLGSTPETVDSPASVDSADQMLFADGELSGLRSRWTEVQSAFVDDPRDCVQKADGLVADVVDRLTAGFSEARSRLEEQWARGEEVSTEDLRIALKRYREFFERLLAI